MCAYENKSENIRLDLNGFFRSPRDNMYESCWRPGLDKNILGVRKFSETAMPKPLLTQEGRKWLGRGFAGRLRADEKGP
jgi:hypothetical protein